MSQNTLCTWCDKKIEGRQVRYHGERICIKCYVNGRKARKSVGNVWKD